MQRELALRMLEARMPRDAVRRRLLEDYRLSASEADFAIREAMVIVRRRSRQLGRHIAASGMVLPAIALVVHFAFGGFVIAAGRLAWGSAMLLVGALTEWTRWKLTIDDDMPI